MFSERKVGLLRDAYEATGRPVLLTEWGVQGMDVNLQSPAAQLYTQAERGRGYCLLGMLSAVRWLDGYLH